MWCRLPVFLWGLTVRARDRNPTFFSELLDVRESEITEEEAAWKQDAARDVTDCEIEDDGDPVEFRDFDTSEECIKVFVPKDRLATTAVAVSTTPDGSDALVLVDGRVRQF